MTETIVKHKGAQLLIDLDVQRSQVGVVKEGFETGKFEDVVLIDREGSMNEGHSVPSACHSQCV